MLDDRRRHSVGASYGSYVYGGHVWGLPVDAACIVCATRPDLIATAPGSWDEIIALARGGWVAQPFSRMSATAIYYLLTRGGVSDEESRAKLRQLLPLAGNAARLEQGSIQVLEAMAGGEDIAFVPACYGYSNYTRAGFARCPITFHPTPLATRGAVLGGAGAAVSAFFENREHALRFVEWLTGAACQSTVYAACGGQPAHAAAWDADLPNRLTGDFYRRLRTVMEAAWARPNTPAFHVEQSTRASELHAMFTGERSHDSL